MHRAVRKSPCCGSAFRELHGVGNVFRDVELTVARGAAVQVIRWATHKRQGPFEPKTLYRLSRCFSGAVGSAVGGGGTYGMSENIAA